MKAEWLAPHLVVTGAGPVPIRLHWSVPIGMLVFGRGTIGGAIGFLVLVLAHELGHALLVRWRKLRAISIDVHWMGGECRYAAGWGTPLDHAIIAWGGVLAQSLLLAAALALGAIVPPGGFVASVLYALVVPNLAMIVLNLLPIGGLDGTLAWRLPGLLRERARRSTLEKEHERLKREIEDLSRRKPE